VGQIVQTGRQLGVEADGGREVREGIGVMGVDPGLRQQQVGSPCPYGRLDHAVEGMHDGLITGERGQGDVQAGAPPFSLAHLGHFAGPREEIASGLVDGDRQDAGVFVEGGLHSVSMVGVEINVRYAAPGLQGDGYGGGRIVVDAET